MNQLELPDPPLDPDDDGMLRMSILEHLDELRARIIHALIGFGVCLFAAMAWARPLWRFVQRPLKEAIAQVHGEIVAITPTEQFSIIWVWTPLVASIFLAAPWVIYQAWAFIAPGLYPRERKWAVPFILGTAGLFLAGGWFAYFIALPSTLGFLLGIGAPEVRPTISIDSYFTTFVNVTLGLSVVFELPVAVFFLTLIHIASPSFLLRNSRYAILVILILASFVTVTQDAVNLAVLSVPMILLYFLGVFASFLLVMRRENRKFPWKMFSYWLAAVMAAASISIWTVVVVFEYHFAANWPFLTK
jgi:sec-independent protein translocase protein TatC